MYMSADVVLSIRKTKSAKPHEKHRGRTTCTLSTSVLPSINSQKSIATRMPPEVGRERVQRCLPGMNAKVRWERHRRGLDDQPHATGGNQTPIEPIGNATRHCEGILHWISTFRIISSRLSLDRINQRWRAFISERQLRLAVIDECQFRA